MSTMKLTLLTDFYELTMMQGYFKNGMNGRVVFDAFYRKNDGGYAVCAGLDQVIDYVKRLTFSDEDIRYLSSLHMFDEDFLDYLHNFRFSGDIYAIPEGTVVFPHEPFDLHGLRRDHTGRHGCGHADKRTSANQLSGQ